MNTSIERGGRGIDMPPPPPPEASEKPEAAPEIEPEAAADRVSAWAKGEADRIAGTTGRPSIEFISTLDSLIGNIKLDASNAGKRADKEQREAIAALEKDRTGAALGHAKQAKEWAEKAVELKNKAEALLMIRDEADKALDAMIHGSDKSEDDTANDMRRAA